MIFIEWCKANDIELGNFINIDGNKTISSETSLQELTQLILSKKKKILVQDTKTMRTKIYFFEKYFFNSNEIELRQVEWSPSQRKQNMLTHSFYNSGSKKNRRFKNHNSNQMKLKIRYI